MKGSKMERYLGSSAVYDIGVKSAQVPLGVLHMSKNKKIKFKEAVRECFGDHIQLTRIANEYVRFLKDLRTLGLPCPTISSPEEAIRAIYDVRDVLLKIKKECNYDSSFFHVATGRIMLFATKDDNEGWVVHMCFDPR
jgi:hypothetical protein